MELKLNQFMPVSDTLESEAEYRKSLNERMIPFGVKFLDDATSGMSPTDLIVVGAKPGVGKTEFVTSLAMQAITRGKRVYLFALEAAKNEITSRIKFRIIANEYFKSNPSSMLKPRLTFRNWYEGRMDPLFLQIEKTVAENWASAFKNFHVRYKQGDFGVDDLKSAILSIKDFADIIIIDHLHYIDHEDTDQNRALHQTMKTIRDLSLISEKPIILVAHVRKSAIMEKSLIPSLDEFHGSSEIAKICTKAIMLAPVFFEVPGLKPTQYPTLMQVAKNRLDGSVTRYCAMTKFDISKNCYEDSYELGRLSSDGKKFETLFPQEVPEWAIQ